jgi:hypothetical protein
LKRFDEVLHDVEQERQRVDEGLTFALFLYFYISAAVLLFGAEVNAAMHHYTWDRHMQVEEHTTGYKAPDANKGSRTGD